MNKINPIIPYIGVLLVDFYLLPLFITSTGMAIAMLLIVVPFICVSTSLIYGLKRPFSWFYPVMVGILFFPSIFMFYNWDAWIYSLAYGVIALLGNLIGLYLKISSSRS